MSPVRLGAVGYLNARPLVYGLERSNRFSLRFDVPAHCAELLHDGAIDLGLIPSIEYLRRPGDARRRDDYRVVPDLAVVSTGAVASVKLYATRAMSAARSIAMDTSSRTSVALVRVLCARVFHVDPVLVPHGPDLPAMLSRCDAALVIGDNALFLDATAIGTRPGGVLADGPIEVIDLGELWTTTTGLPFVYAFWAGRPGAAGAADVAELTRARDLGEVRSDEVARAYFKGAPARQAEGARYLRDNIQYHLGDAERAGLELFYRYAAEAGVVAPGGEIRFY